MSKNQTQPDFIPGKLIEAACSLRFLSRLFYQGERAHPVELDISSSDGLSIILSDIGKKVRDALEEVEDYIEIPEDLRRI